MLVAVIEVGHLSPPHGRGRGNFIKKKHLSFFFVLCLKVNKKFESLAYFTPAFSDLFGHTIT